MLGPQLQGDQVTLGPFDPIEAAANTWHWFTDPEVMRYYLSSTRSQTDLQAFLEEQVRSDRDVVWALYARDSHIGYAGITDINWISRRGETDTIIGVKDAWGKGYAREAVLLRTRFAFEELRLHGVWAEVVAGNAASIRMLERAGYRQAGLLREFYWRNGRWHDKWLGQLLREDWGAAGTTTE